MTAAAFVETRRGKEELRLCEGSGLNYTLTEVSKLVLLSLQDTDEVIESLIS